MFRIYTSSVRGASDGFGRAYATVSERVGAQPSWAVRAAVLAGLGVFLAVVVLLVIPAVVVGLVVLAVLAAAYALKQRVAGWLGGGRGGLAEGGLAEGRRNVRVIEPRDA